MLKSTKTKPSKLLFSEVEYAAVPSSVSFLFQIFHLEINYTNT